jgi:Na+/melibiose symporter-like transporter
MALFLALVIISFYPLSGKKLEGLREKLAEIHAQKGIS